ncbi:hypothetical protein N7540_003350 [Penicillium herquei]|nr:hypothetical protein N7540_003350 [Penicillium herquei]
MLQELRTCFGTSEKKLLQVIDRLPESADQAYEQILQRCSKKNETHTKLLEVIVAAHRPLTLGQINIMLELDPNVRSYDSLDLEGNENRERWIRETGGLFVVVFESRVHLIHETSKDFLLQQTGRRAANHSWKASIELDSANFVLCTRCITYLLFTDFWRNKTGLPLSIYERPPRPCTGLLEYAANNWFFHMHNVHIRDSKWVEKAAKLCERESSTWIQSCRFQIDSFGLFSRAKTESLISIAMGCGLLQVMDLLLKRSTVNLSDLILEAAGLFHFAAMVVAFLLDRKETNLKITEELFQVALRNPTCLTELMNTLLDRTRAAVTITEAMVRAVDFRGIKILLNRGAKVKITKGIVIASKGDDWRSLRAPEGMIKALIDQEGLDKCITEQGFLEVFRQYSADVVELLLNRTGSYFPITDELLNAASSNLDGCRILQLLLD